MQDQLQQYCTEVEDAAVVCLTHDLWRYCEYSVALGVYFTCIVVHIQMHLYVCFC